MSQDTFIDKVSREVSIVCNGTAEGLFTEEWHRAQNPVSLGGTIARDTLIGTAAAAVCKVAPEVVLPALALTAGSLLLEDNPQRQEALARSARLVEACQTAWNDPTQELGAKRIFAHELGKPAFDFLLCSATLGAGFSLGTRLAEAKIAQIAEKTLASKSMFMTDLGEGTFQTRIGNSLVTTRADGTVIKQFDNGLIQRHIPTGNGDYIFTEVRPSGVLTMTLPDATRMIEFPSGRSYIFETNGTYSVQRPSGLRMSANDSASIRTFTHPNGTITNYIGNYKQRIFPDKQ